MSENLSQKLVVAISSRALFDLNDGNAIFEKQGIDAYAQYQIERENEILSPGSSFKLVQKFLNLNKKHNLIEIILLSRNSADTGLRIFNSIKHYGLDISRAVFTSGESPYQYLQAFAADLFLSMNHSDVENALRSGYAAATILPSSSTETGAEELRIAFDGDAVLFSDEAEKIFQRYGIDAFHQSEEKSARKPLIGGPFKGFLSTLHRIQQLFPPESCPIRTALVTARQAPAHERVIHTLRSWNIRIDEALFLGGLDKKEFLQAFKADIFFDDRLAQCEKTSAAITTGHVPHGVMNSE